MPWYARRRMMSHGRLQVAPPRPGVSARQCTFKHAQWLELVAVTLAVAPASGWSCVEEAFGFAVAQDDGVGGLFEVELDSSESVTPIRPASRRSARAQLADSRSRRPSSRRDDPELLPEHASRSA